MSECDIVIQRHAKAWLVCTYPQFTEAGNQWDLSYIEGSTRYKKLPAEVEQAVSILQLLAANGGGFIEGVGSNYSASVLHNDNVRKWAPVTVLLNEKFAKMFRSVKQNKQRGVAT